MLAYIEEHRTTDEPFTVVHQNTVDADAISRWSDYAAVGVDWWLESFRSEQRDVDVARRIIDAGPPTG
jgi:hypothetical protein